MKNYVKLFTAIFCLTFLLDNVFYASSKTPTLNGPTGLVKMPTAVVLGQKDFDIGIDYLVDGSTVGTGSDVQGIWVYKANIGSFSGSTKGLELGFVGRTERVTNRFKEGVFINLKYSLASSDDINALKLAIGIENLTSLNETGAYMVASKYWSGGAGIHFGAMFDFPNNERFRPLGMFGINMPLGDRNFMLMSEIFAGETLFQLDAGINLDINKNISLLARGINITNNDIARDAKSFSVGFSIANFI